MCKSIADNWASPGGVPDSDDQLLDRDALLTGRRAPGTTPFVGAAGKGNRTTWRRAQIPHRKRVGYSARRCRDLRPIKC